MKKHTLLSIACIVSLLACSEPELSGLDFYNNCFYHPKTVKEYCFVKTFNHLCGSNLNPANENWQESAMIWLIDHPESKQHLETLRHEVVLSGSEETRNLLKAIDDVMPRE